MDWLRAKIVFIVAFLCLDVFLGWQVRRLTVPVLYLQFGAAGVVPAVTPLGAASGVYVFGPASAGLEPARVPSLTVATVGVDPQGEVLLGKGTICGSPPGAVALYTVDCRDNSGRQVLQLGGALVFTSPRAVPGVRSVAAARAVADALVRAVDPVGVAFSAMDPYSATTHTRTLIYVETYDGLPLFDGTWTITLGASGITATRFWLHVQARSGAAAPIISARQALGAAGAAYGASARHPLDVQGPVTFGFYYPVRQPPARLQGGRLQARNWQLVPVWRVRTTEDRCLFVDAYNGQPEPAPASAAAAWSPC